MNITDRLIIRTFLASYAILLATGVGLYIAVHLLFNVDEFTEAPQLSAGQILANMASYYGYNLPLYYQQLGGVLLTFAAGFTFAMMLRNNELTPLAAAGVPLQRLALPVMLCSVVLVAVWMMNGELLVPAVAEKTARAPDDLAETRHFGVPWARDDHNVVLTAEEIRARSGVMLNLNLIELDAEGGPRRVVRADRAEYDFERGVWVLDERARQVMPEPAFADDGLGSQVHWRPLAEREYHFGLSPEQILLRQSSQWAERLSIRQMNDLLQAGNQPNRAAIARARDVRFTQPLVAWILMLLVMPYFLSREPGNVLVAGGKALALAGLCFGFVFISHSMAMDARSAMLAVWLPVLVFGPVSVLHLANVKT